MPRGLFCFAALCVTIALLLCACTRSLPPLPSTERSPEQATQTALAYRSDLAALAATAAYKPGTTPAEEVPTTQLSSPTSIPGNGSTPATGSEPEASITPGAGNTSGAGSTPSVNVPPTETPEATATPALPVPPLPGAITLAPPQAAQNADCNRVKFVKDVATPDNTRVRRHQHFVKTWRLKNAGGCTWTPDYALVFVDGSQMQGQPIHLPGNVAPGESINLSLGLVAPSRPGTHRGYWMLQGPAGRFGMGDSAGQPFWVQVVVHK